MCGIVGILGSHPVSQDLVLTASSEDSAGFDLGDQFDLDGEPVHAVVEFVPKEDAMTKRLLWSNLEAGSLQAAMDLENLNQLLVRLNSLFAGSTIGIVLQPCYRRDLPLPGVIGRLTQYPRRFLRSVETH